MTLEILFILYFYRFPNFGKLSRGLKKTVVGDVAIVKAAGPVRKVVEVKHEKAVGVDSYQGDQEAEQGHSGPHLDHANDGQSGGSEGNGIGTGGHWQHKGKGADQGRWQHQVQWVDLHGQCQLP